MSGFKVTGIFPFDRKALVPEPEDDTSPYLPLLTPRRHTNRRVIVDDVTLDNSHFSNGISDSSFESSLTLLPRRSSFSEMLHYPSPIPVPKRNPQSKESRVLTSDKNLKRIEEKKIAKEKARKKELTEQKKIDKANNKKKRVINDKSDNKADTLTQPGCTLKKTALGNDVIDSWHRGTLKKCATND
uniref:Uncharacterized protein n=1 Tax=Amphimedon queenslandica TaxID=400682 RepID=A0A1X7U3F2_AMPQE